ncbi:MAG: zinc ribbon domain-containing protein [Lachnospiraceae bacterium]|nr:zinc ribbon domain-containing protein [Lachnospiraceae bacterium]
MGKYCKNCGQEISPGSPFCGFCGASQETAQSNNPPYQPVQQPVYNTTRVTTAKATGLVVGIFSLIAVFILTVLVFILPSKEDLTLLALSGGQQISTEPGLSDTEQVDSSSSELEYGAVPDWVLNSVNPNAVKEDYYGSYTGKASFRSQNIETMAELTGDQESVEILSRHNGNTYDCTAEVDTAIVAFGEDIYSEEEDGSFYSFFYDYYLENGAAIDEVEERDESMGLSYHAGDKAYFLTDGKIYVVTGIIAELSDGTKVGSEIRIELTPMQ